jgi:hypothetical protein
MARNCHILHMPMEWMNQCTHRKYSCYVKDVWCICSVAKCASIWGRNSVVHGANFLWRLQIPHTSN